MEKKIENYVELILEKGINLQKNQILVMNSPVEVYDFTRKIVKKAYELGASEVVVHWNDEISVKYRYMHGADEIFDIFPEWQRESLEYYRKKGAAFLSVYANDPDNLKDVDKERVARAQKARSIALKEYYENVMRNSNQWCVVSAPTKAWAEKVFPEFSGDKAKDALWEAILKIVRADNNEAISEWNIHLENLKNRTEYLNKKAFDKLKYRNSLGTDLEIGLPENHIWVGGGEESQKGVYFVANIPTEEIFTLPHRERVNGVVVSSKPLIYGGSTIDKFRLKFENGKVVEYSAEIGEDVLEKLLNTDENARYLGEVALVEDRSPISQSKRVFYNTLYDENASCHLALGRAYPSCLKNSAGKNEDELKQLGVNDSLIHEDFMIGTSDMEIIGVDKDGNETLIMKNGNFVF